LGENRPKDIMSNLPPDPLPTPAQGLGWLIALAALVGTVLTPVAAWARIRATRWFCPPCLETTP
jgi:hypothetical protein